MRSENINELAAALAKAQLEMEGAKKDTSNPFYKSKYADLHSIIQAIKEPLAKNGLAYSQIISENELKTLLLHTSGQWLQSVMILKPTKDDMQGLGSAISYARRYALQAIVGLSAEDDDGNQASGVKTQSHQEVVLKDNIKTETQVVEKPKTLTLKDIVAEKAKSIFADPDEFKVWRTDNGYAEKLSEISEMDLAKILFALKEMSKK